MIRVVFTVAALVSVLAAQSESRPASSPAARAPRLRIELETDTTALLEAAAEHFAYYDRWKAEVVE